MSTLTSATTTKRTRSVTRPLDLTALTGALFVLGVIGAYFVWGSTPDGDASPTTVITHYTEHRTQGIAAAQET